MNSDSVGTGAAPFMSWFFNLFEADLVGREYRGHNSMMDEKQGHAYNILSHTKPQHKS